jgi:protein-S-isoprenylcysteine O-methyltransferase Ste14
MVRVSFFIFGVICHAMFLAVFLYMAAFVGNLPVPKTIDAPIVAGTPVQLAVLINIALLALFAVPHSVMARPAFKRAWTRVIPPAIERSVYVLIANLCVILLMWQWRPIGPVIWDVQGFVGRALVWTLFAAGWLLVPLASLMINHFDLFGTRQVWLNLKQVIQTDVTFRTPALYKLVRHPLYVGWMISFWATPTMTLGHVLFATLLTAYMFIAIPIEERDLVKVYGSQYEDYRRRVPALVPRIARGSTVSAAPEQRAIVGELN